jgi:ATP-dependent 26S proteasome regulatory subunit
MGKKKVLVKIQPEGKYGESPSMLDIFLPSIVPPQLCYLSVPLSLHFVHILTAHTSLRSLLGARLITVVDFSDSIPLSALTPNLRVALRSDSYKLHSILPNKIDPLVSLMMVEKVPDSTYEMVGGLDKQIKEIKEVIELPVKHPELFESLGIAQPKGVLLYGPPGTGKTLLARAVAHHTDCRFIRVSGSELVQKYIGEGSRMVRELFVMAREHVGIRKYRGQ